MWFLFSYSNRFSRTILTSIHLYPDGCGPTKELQIQLALLMSVHTYSNKYVGVCMDKTATPNDRGLRTLFEHFCRPSMFFRDSLLTYPSFSTPKALHQSAIRLSIVRSRCVILGIGSEFTHYPVVSPHYHAQNLEMSIHTIS